MSALSANLETLQNLHRTLEANVAVADKIQKDTDRAVENTEWESPNATKFREQWAEFKPALVAFEQALAEAATDVADNHNKIANANGATDAPNLSPVSAIG